MVSKEVRLGLPGCNLSKMRIALSMVQTAPNVTYEILTKNGELLRIYNPQKVPDAGDIEEFRQPIVRVSFVLPSEVIGPVMQLCNDRRGDRCRVASRDRSLHWARRS